MADKGKDDLDASEQADSTMSSLLGGVEDAYNAGDTYTGAGDTTQQGWDDALAASGNQDYANGTYFGTKNTSDILSNGGATDGMWWATKGTGDVANDYGSLADSVKSGADTSAIEKKITDDTLQATNSAFNSSGMFGSDSNQDSAAQGVADGLASYKYDNYWKSVQSQMDALAGKQSALGDVFSEGQQGIDNTYNGADALSSYYDAGQAKADTEQAVGAAQDDEAQADSNSTIDWLSNLFGSMGGTTSTDTSSSGSSWWEQLLGYMASAA